MNDAVASETANIGLSEVERVVDTFIAPTKTFNDILRSASWWLPFVLTILVSLGFVYAIDRQVGFARVVENQMHQNPRAEERLNQLTEAQRNTQLRTATTITRYTSYGSVVFALIIAGLAALVLWASINFGLGARSRYPQIFAVWWYASLPMLIKSLMAIVVLLFGGGAESFDMKNPVGTNLAYYMPDAAGWLRTILSFFDIFSLWQITLLILGISIVAKVSRGKAAAVVLGWWFLILLVSVSTTAILS